MQVLQVRDGLSKALLSAFNEEGRLLDLLEDAEQRHTRQTLQTSLTALKAARKELSAVRIKETKVHAIRRHNGSLCSLTFRIERSSECHSNST